MAVDHRPIAERGAKRALFLVACVIASCAALGGASFGYLMFHRTAPKDYRRAT